MTMLQVLLRSELKLAWAVMNLSVWQMKTMSLWNTESRIPLQAQSVISMQDYLLTGISGKTEIWTKADWDAAKSNGIYLEGRQQSRFMSECHYCHPIILLTGQLIWQYNSRQSRGNLWRIHRSGKIHITFFGNRQDTGRCCSRKDVANVIGSSPYNIPSNGEITIAFALIAGDNLNDLKTNAIAAKNKYNLFCFR